MLIKFNSFFTCKKLLKLCKINRVKFISNFNKGQIINRLNTHKTVSYIQRFYRKKLMKSEYCPISYEKIVYPFISIKLGSFFFYYDFLTFIKYLGNCGDFRDPCTRISITDTKINEINKLIIYYHGKNTSKTLISPTMVYDNELNIITFCLYDIIKELNDIASTVNITQVYNNILPRIIYYIHFLIKNHQREHYDLIINACINNITINNNTSLVINYLKLSLKI